MRGPWGVEQLDWKTALLEAQIDSSLDGIIVVDNLGHKFSKTNERSICGRYPDISPAMTTTGRRSATSQG